MSDELYRLLRKGIDDELRTIDGGVEHFRELLLRVSESGSISFELWVEGFKTEDMIENEIMIDILERAGLLDVERRFTHRNAYLEVKLTDVGKDLVSRLKN